MSVGTYFITGVSGCGKTAILRRLEELLPSTHFDFHDIDERGVPADTPPSWRASETEHWLSIAVRNAEAGRSTVISGTVHSDETVGCPSFARAPTAHFFLLEANDRSIRARLKLRFASPHVRELLWRQQRMKPEAFIEAMFSYRDDLRRLFENSRCSWTALDTSELSEEETTSIIAKWLQAA